MPVTALVQSYNASSNTVIECYLRCRVKCGAHCDSDCHTSTLRGPRVEARCAALMMMMVLPLALLLHPADQGPCRPQQQPACGTSRLPLLLLLAQRLPWAAARVLQLACFKQLHPAFCSTVLRAASVITNGCLSSAANHWHIGKRRAGGRVNQLTGCCRRGSSQEEADQGDTLGLSKHEAYPEPCRSCTHPPPW
jgi:hypothetical protein